MPDSLLQPQPSAPGAKGALQRFTADLRAGLQHHGLLLAVSAAILVFGNIVSVSTGYVVPMALSDFIGRFVVFAGLVVLGAAAAWTFLTYLMVERRPRMHREFLRWLIRQVFDPARWLNGVFAMSGVLMLVLGCLQAKNNALRLAGHELDRQFSAADRLLHFGFLPQDLLRPLLGLPAVIRVLDITYVGWQPVMLGAIFAAAFQPRRSLLRHRFLLALTLVLGFGGGVLAVVLASGGPAFYGALTGLPDPYAAHMAFLARLNEASPLNAVITQQLLWSSREAPGGISMISAMPSMHVAVAGLVALAAWRFGWQARLARLAFLVLTMLGSVLLGWHYAVDGYAGLLIAWGSWKLALPLSRWYLAEGASAAA